MSGIIEKVKETIERFSMFKYADRLLLCVSGGPDSVTMALIVKSLSSQMGLKLFIAHFNHKLRGIESDKDSDYVRRLAKRLEVPYITAAEDVGAYAKDNKISLEDAARRLRYNFFFRTAVALNIKIIATAHTKDDQAETVLMRLLRGTGLRGLKGISPVRSILTGLSSEGEKRLKTITLVRPLINTSKSDIQKYLKSHRIKPRIDTSNSESRFFRNKIRLKLLPFLEKEYNPRAKELLSNLAETLNKDYEYLATVQGALFEKVARPAKDSIKFSIKDFKRQHIALQRGLARIAIEILKKNLKAIDYRHWEEIEELVYKRPDGSAVHLPGGIGVIKSKGFLIFKIADKKKLEAHNTAAVVLNIPGITYFGGKKIKAQVLKKRVSFRPHHKREEFFDMAKLDTPLTVRFRRPGDRIMPLGMKQEKKIKRLLIDEKIPLNRRDKIPIVVSAKGEIIWLCGIRMSEKFKVEKDADNILRLKLIQRY